MVGLGFDDRVPGRVKYRAEQYGGKNEAAQVNSGKESARVATLLLIAAHVADLCLINPRPGADFFPVVLGL